MTAMCRWQLYCLVAAFALADVVLGDAPRAELHSGGSIPLVGLGTGRDQELEAAVDAALAAGYRLFDTATLYRNEHIIGRVLKRWLQEGKVKREDLFIVTKLPPFGMRAGDVSAILAKSLSDLQLDYVDMYLIHMPYGLARDGFDENWDVKSGAWDMTTDHVAIWKAMEAEFQAGRVKALGLSNFNETQIERVMKSCVVRPSNLQVELHLLHQQKPLVQFCQRNNIRVTAFAPLGRPGSTLRRDLPDTFTIPAVTEIARRYNKTSAQVMLRHSTQRGVVVIPRTVKPHRLRENMDVFDFTLTDEEMVSLNSLDKGLDGKMFDMTGFEGVQKHPEYPWSALIK